MPTPRGHASMRPPRRLLFGPPVLGAGGGGVWSLEGGLVWVWAWAWAWAWAFHILIPRWGAMGFRPAQQQQQAANNQQPANNHQTERSGSGLGRKWGLLIWPGRRSKPGGGVDLRPPEKNASLRASRFARCRFAKCLILETRTANGNARGRPLPLLFSLL